MIGRALVRAQRAADETLARALARADEIIADAERRARGIAPPPEPPPAPPPAAELPAAEPDRARRRRGPRVARRLHRERRWRHTDEAPWAWPDRAEGAPDSDEDDFFADLRRALAEDEPLGPRPPTLGR